MIKFLADYGLKWVGTDGPPAHQGNFDADAVNKELDF